MLARSSSLSTASETPDSSSFRTSGVGELSRRTSCATTGATLAKALATRTSAAQPNRRGRAITEVAVAKAGPRGAPDVPRASVTGLSAHGRPRDSEASRGRPRTDAPRTVKPLLESRQQLVVVRSVRDPLDQPLHSRLRRHLPQ